MSLKWSDIDPARWRDYTEINTDSLMLFGSRRNDGLHKETADFHGKFIPQVAEQMIKRYSKKEGVVLDLMMGSGTTAIECLRLRRYFVGVELYSSSIYALQQLTGQGGFGSDQVYLEANSTNIGIIPTIEDAIHGVSRLAQRQANLTFLHPPYYDIIKFGDDGYDLSNSPTPGEFLFRISGAAEVAYKSTLPGGFAVVVIGDIYQADQTIPLGFMVMEEFLGQGFHLKAINVKDIQGNEKGKGKNSNLWRYRALAGGYSVFKHEYIFVLRKPEK